MKWTCVSAALLTAVACIQPASAALVSAGFGSNTGASIDFTGGSNFSFTSTSIGGFQIKSESGGAALINLDGDITGTYNIGTVTTFGPTEMAPVTGSGQLIIYDGGGTTGSQFTATLTWLAMSQTGTGVNANVNGTVNLSAMSYSGSNADLLSLKNTGSGLGIATLALTFNSTTTLDQLKTGVFHDNYTGTISPLPEPGFYGVLCLGLISIVAGAKRVNAKARLSKNV
jgi:hypothetical protein